MKKRIPIGVHNFKKLIEEDYYYVDKTSMIKEVILDGSEVILLPRPRRFGKTLNMSMLRHFFDINNAAENRKLFDGLNIAHEEVFEVYQGRYPVISISFRDIKSNTFEEAHEKITDVIKNEFYKNRFLLESDLFDEGKKTEFRSIAHGESSNAKIESSLLLLCEFLFTFYQVKPYVLVDEYDTPVHSSYSNQYYPQMISFMGSLLGALFKDNEFLEKGILTGTLRISKESIFTGFNNPSVYSVIRNEFSTQFGFTHEELKKMLDYYEISQFEEGIRNWYNGYIFGNTEIYNPWSILNFVHSQDKRFIAHWVNTSSNDLIRELILESPKAVRTELEDLLKGVALIKRLNENISFPELKSSEDAVFSFLVFSGYLKAKLLKFEDLDYWYELTIPNIEVAKLYETIILKWFNESFSQSKSTDLINSLLTGDTELFEELLGLCVLQTLSVYEVEKREVERVYQAFILGLLVRLIPEYEVTSNKESGYGRYDICIVPLRSSKKPAIIMELKSIRPKETAKKALASALEQIETKQYETAIRQRGYDNILKMAIVFDGKRVWVKTS